MSTGEIADDPISKRAAFWFSILKFVGWPGATLIVVCWGFWTAGSRGAEWAAPRIDAAVTNHFTMVNGLLEQGKLQTQILDEIKENQKIYAKALEHHGELIGEIHSAVLPKQKAMKE